MSVNNFEVSEVNPNLRFVPGSFDRDSQYESKYFILGAEKLSEVLEKLFYFSEGNDVYTAVGKQFIGFFGKDITPLIYYKALDTIKVFIDTSTQSPTVDYKDRSLYIHKAAKQCRYLQDKKWHCFVNDANVYAMINPSIATDIANYSIAGLAGERTVEMLMQETCIKFCDYFASVVYEYVFRLGYSLFTMRGGNSGVK